MSDTNAVPAVQVTSPASEKATLKKAFSMGWFLSKEAKRKAKLDSMDGLQTTQTLGQIVGNIVEVRKQVSAKFQNSDGSPKVDLIAVGEFVGINYSTGEEREAYGAYLPRYYLETIEAALRLGAPSVPFGLEICLESSGKADDEIGYSYTVRNLAARRADNPLEQMKRHLASRGLLRVSAPVEPETDNRIAGLPDAASPAPLLEHKSAAPAAPQAPEFEGPASDEDALSEAHTTARSRRSKAPAEATA